MDKLTLALDLPLDHVSFSSDRSSKHEKIRSISATIMVLWAAMVPLTLACYLPTENSDFIVTSFICVAMVPLTGLVSHLMEENLRKGYARELHQFVEDWEPSLACSEVFNGNTEDLREVQSRLKDEFYFMHTMKSYADMFNVLKKQEVLCLQLIDYYLENPSTFEITLFLHPTIQKLYHEYGADSNPPIASFLEWCRPRISLQRGFEIKFPRWICELFIWQSDPKVPCLRYINASLQSEDFRFFRPFANPKVEKMFAKHCEGKVENEVLLRAGFLRSLQDRVEKDRELAGTLCDAMLKQIKKNKSQFNDSLGFYYRKYY